MNEITTKQNSTEFIELLKAQRVAYSISKKCSSVEYIIVTISIVIPVLLIFFPDFNNQSTVILISGSLMICSILLDNLMKNKTSIAAKIQEEFDNGLFGLEWNTLLCDNKVENEDIIRLAKKYKKYDLHNWYSSEIKPELSHEIAVLFCQKTNAFWDKDLRKKYKIVLFTVLGLYYLFLIVLSYLKQIQFDEFLLLSLPTLTFLKFQIQLIRIQNQIISKKENIITKINALFNKYRVDSEIPNYSDLREIQNAIYSLRTNTNKIPDFFYRLYKKSYESLTDDSIKMKINEINN